jgi:tetratricopeptide (TPR) repeat protein
MFKLNSKRIRIFFRYVLPILAFLVAAAALYPRLDSWWEKKKLLWEKEKQCRQRIVEAEQLARQDRFEDATTALDEVRETCAAASLREEDFLRARLEAIKAMVEYDQIQRVSKKNLKVIEDKWSYVKNDPNVGATKVLRGIIEELYYRPDKAIEQYLAVKDDDPNYVSARIRLAYVYFKWGLEGSNSEKKAMENLDAASRAAQQSNEESERKNPWPDIAKAYIHLSQAQTLLDICAQRLSGKCADSRSSNPRSARCDNTDDVRARLASAKSSLENAVSLSANNDNPKLYLLWGHYHFLEGFLRCASGLGDPDQSYHAARNYLLDKAIAMNPDIADAHLLLGGIYEELAKNKTAPTGDDYERAALAEYAEAVSLDKCNIIARSAYAHSLLKQERHAEAAEQAQVGIRLIDQFVQDLDKHLWQVNRDDLREWLRKTREEYSSYRVDLLQMAQVRQTLRATTASIRQETPVCE